MPGSYDLAGKVIGAAMRVHSSLGPGFMERVYANALAIELRLAKIAFEQEHTLIVRYLGESVGHYVANFMVEGTLIVELKAVEGLVKPHHAQLVNYLTATGVPEGLLLNFGAPKLEFHKKHFRRPSQFPFC